MGQIRRRGRDIDPVVYDELRRLATQTDSSAAHIEAELHRQFGQGRDESRRVPKPSTIKRVIRDERPRDPTGPWSFTGAEPEDARLILPVLAAVALPGLRITLGEAEWIVRVARAAPGIPPNTCRVVARSYMAAKQQNVDAYALDAFLAFAPWSDAKREAYQRAIDKGFVPGATALLELSTRESREENADGKRIRKTAGQNVGGGVRRAARRKRQA